MHIHTTCTYIYTTYTYIHVHIRIHHVHTTYTWYILDSGKNWREKTCANQTPFANILPSQILNSLKYIANVSDCKSANIFPHQNSETIDLPKFYPTKILHYTVLLTYMHIHTAYMYTYTLCTYIKNSLNIVF